MRVDALDLVLPMARALCARAMPTHLHCLILAHCHVSTVGQAVDARGLTSPRLAAAMTIVTSMTKWGFRCVITGQESPSLVRRMLQESEEAGDPNPRQRLRIFEDSDPIKRRHPAATMWYPTILRRNHLLSYPLSNPFDDLVPRFWVPRRIRSIAEG